MSTDPELARKKELQEELKELILREGLVSPPVPHTKTYLKLRNRMKSDVPLPAKVLNEIIANATTKIENSKQETKKKTPKASASLNTANSKYDFQATAARPRRRSEEANAQSICAAQ